MEKPGRELRWGGSGAYISTTRRQLCSLLGALPHDDDDDDDETGQAETPFSPFPSLSSSLLLPTPPSHS